MRVSSSAIRPITIAVTIQTTRPVDEDDDLNRCEFTADQERALHDAGGVGHHIGMQIFRIPAENCVLSVDVN